MCLQTRFGIATLQWTIVIVEDTIQYRANRRDFVIIFGFPTWVPTYFLVGIIMRQVTYFTRAYLSWFYNRHSLVWFWRKANSKRFCKKPSSYSRETGQVPLAGTQPRLHGTQLCKEYNYKIVPPSLTTPQSPKRTPKYQFCPLYNVSWHCRATNPHYLGLR